MSGLSLQKNQSLSLVKDNGSALTKVRLGLGWDEIQQQKKGLFGFGGGSSGGDIDLDASAILISGNQIVDIVYYGQLDSKDRSVHHTGDNLTGAGDGDDEQIEINLGQVSANVDRIVLAITSYSGQKFNQIENVFARVVDLSSGPEKEVVRYNLADGGNQTANIIAKLTRGANGWDFTALGIPATAKTPGQLTTEALRA